MAMAPYVLVLAKNAHEGSTYVRRAQLQRGRWRVVAKASSVKGIRRAHVHALPGFYDRPDRHAIAAVLRHSGCEWFDVEMPEAPPRDQGDGLGEQLTIDEALAERRRSMLPMETDQINDAHDALDAEPSIVPELAKIAAQIAKVDVDQLKISADSISAERIMPGIVSGDRLSIMREMADDLDESETAWHDGIPEDVLEEERTKVEEAEEVTLERPKQRRRTRCSTCEDLHFKDEPCTVEEAKAPLPPESVFE